MSISVQCIEDRMHCVHIMKCLSDILVYPSFSFSYVVNLRSFVSVHQFVIEKVYKLDTVSYTLSYNNLSYLCSEFSCLSQIFN